VYFVTKFVGVFVRFRAPASIKISVAFNWFGTRMLTKTPMKQKLQNTPATNEKQVVIKRNPKPQGK
jgi:hypothetical protein